MDFNSIAARHPRDTEMPERCFRLAMLNKVLNGSFYDILPYAFHDEQVAGEYVKVVNRRPNVTFKFLRQVVEDSVSFLFGEARFPAVDCKDEVVRQQFVDLIAESNLENHMREAALSGSVGSVVVYMRILRQRVHFKVLSTTNLTPEYDPLEPDTLIKVTEKYKVRGKDLADQGYDIPDDEMGSMFWFQRIFDVNGEWFYVPWKVLLDRETPQQRMTRQRKYVPVIDQARSQSHELKFLPMRWIKNLPGGDETDGASTITPALDIQIQIDYQLSQAGRALKYSADPLLLIKEPASGDGEFIRTANNALQVDSEGDAKLLEISGNAANAVIEYVKWLREAALESMHANRASADRMSAAQSGAALKLHYAPMIQLADALRSTYGEGLLAMMDMVRRASNVVPLRLYGELVVFPAKERLSLRWPDFFVTTPQDRNLEAASYVQLREAGLMSRETGVREIASEYDVHDVAHEIALIHQDEAENDAREKALATALAQVKISSTIT